MKHRIFRLVVFLVLGMLLATLVAWLLTEYQPVRVNWLDARLMGRAQEPLWDVRTYSRRGAMRIESDAGMTRVLREPRQAPHWSRASVAPTKEDVEARLHVVENAYGWPMLSHFHRETTRHGEDLAVFEWSATVPDPSKRGRTANRELPLGPIWPGLAINTILYAALLWLLTLGPFTLRRVLRRKRGRCIKCGYDLRGAEHEVCPECGAACGPSTAASC